MLTVWGKGEKGVELKLLYSKNNSYQNRHNPAFCVCRGRWTERRKALYYETERRKEMYGTERTGCTVRQKEGRRCTI